ncbi:hypothetical protein 7S3_24 [uncultured Caudovirales phage]|uniref:Uncharacterized protein n=1 Tax=uncultured Caudovirales phage TaxID=2100421 RepID=A0A2H4J2A3_9CAUD|nr:hypothetical protein 7S3_24 [uncultured Caudovirales phage]
MFMGSQRIRELYVGGQRIRSAHMWNGSAWQRVHMWPVTAPSRVNKSGNQVVSSAWGTVTDWTLAGGYQGAATTNGLLVVGAGTVDITTQITSPVGHYQYVRIMRNGVQVGPEGFNNATTPTVSTTAAGITVNDGDVISVTYNGIGTGDINKTVSGGSGTYIQITAA